MGNEGSITKSAINTRFVGSKGEDQAAEYLVSKGYEILRRNWRCTQGEIDLIALDPQGVTAFVEVKKARIPAFGGPEFWVHQKKQRLLYRLAQAYLHKNRIYKIRSRFDVIAITENDGQIRIRHIQNAFIKM